MRRRATSSRPLQPAQGLIRVWDAPLRVFHWALAVTVVMAIVSARAGGGWMQVHGLAGYVIVGLLGFRLVWGFVGSTHARFANFWPTRARLAAYLHGRGSAVGHNPLGALSVLAMLATLSVQAGLGLFANDDLGFAGPLTPWVSDEQSSLLTGWHHWLGNALLVLLGLHLAAIAFHVIVRRQALVRAMLGGRQAGDATQAARGGGVRPVLVSLAVGLAVALAASGVWRGSDPPTSNRPSAPRSPPPAW